MLRNLGLLFAMLVIIGCGGGGDGTTTQEFKLLEGQLTDGDVRILDNQLADPYDFVATRTGTAIVQLETTGMVGLIRVHDAEGNLISQSSATGDSQAEIRFDVLSTNLYKILVTAQSSLDQGSYRVLYSNELILRSQIKAAP